MRTIRPVVRSETSASPLGRNAIPQGTWRPVATVLAATPEGAAGELDPAPQAQRRTTNETRAKRRIPEACLSAAKRNPSGGGGIRTLEGRGPPLAVFKTAAFDRSATPP